MARGTFLHRSSSRVMRRPIGGGGREPFQDPRGPGRHSTLPYREATELLRCIEIMGPDSGASCREEVLGERQPRGGVLPAATPPTPAGPAALATQTVANISSPVPVGATALQGGGRQATISGIQVTIQPDAASTDQAMANRAETHISFSWSGLGYSTDAQGNVTSFTPASIRATVSTTYGPGVTAASPSAYGRGTTAADIAAGTTSLGFHEGRHGLDYISTLNATPAPVFTGSVGQAEADFLAARTAFDTAVAAYFAAAETASQLSTDCVGITIDQHNAQQGTITNICPAPAAAPAPAPGGTP